MILGHPLLGAQVAEHRVLVQIVSSHNENNYTHLCFVRKRSPRDFFSILLVVQAISPVSALAEIPGFPATGLEDRIAFWEKVFTIYGEEDRIIHDTERVNLIYDVVDEEVAPVGRRACAPPAERGAAGH